MKKLTLYSLILLPVGSDAYAQSFYSPRSYRESYVPTEGLEEGNMIVSNPANSISTGVYQIVSNKLSSKSDFSNKQNPGDSIKSQLSQDSYTGGVLSSMGAGMYAGFLIEKYFAKISTEDSGRNEVPYEMMTSEVVTGRVVIEVATDVTLGVQLRWSHQTGNILGNIDAPVEEQRIRYRGNLLGHGAGLSYKQPNYKIAAAYIPAERGKSEILSEQRIITEPGFVLIEGATKAGAFNLGAGFERAVHKRDERAVSVVSEDGFRSVELDGISPDKYAQPKLTYHLGCDGVVSPQINWTTGISLTDGRFIVDGQSSPDSNSDADPYRATDIKFGIDYLKLGPVDLQARIKYRTLTGNLTSKSGNNLEGSTYKATMTYLSLGVSGSL